MLCFALLIFPGTVLAQESSSGDIDSCFAYYNYGKVATHFGTDKQSYAAGETVTLTGTLENTNTNPLTNLTLYALVRREAPTTTRTLPYRPSPPCQTSYPGCECVTVSGHVPFFWVPSILTEITKRNPSS